MLKPILAIVIGSTRPGRVGPKFAEWFRERAATSREGLGPRRLSM